ncbi:MAG: tetratricopeptide repeat protein [Thermoguttaceae bacterium]|nr:tetratricopeptide repeat protein [Thermoguttaceae bacterium]
MPWFLVRFVAVHCMLLAVAFGAEDDLSAARSLLLSGRYGEAREIYQRTAAKDPAAAVGLARSLAAVGKDGEAIQALRSAGDHPDAQAELARLAFERGDYRTAQAHAHAAIRAQGDQLLARWILAELHRTAGRLPEAERGYRWLVEYYNSHDVTDPESLRWIGLAAAQFARWNRLSDQFSRIVNEVLPDALKSEPAYWPAMYEAGRLFAEKFNRADATQKYQAALALNPHAAEVHAAMARLALEHRDLEQAEASLRRALEINPRLLDAWLLKADLAWANFEPDGAAELLRTKALPLHPVAEGTLGRLAACYALADGAATPGKDSRLAKLVAEVTARNPHPGEFYMALASWLEERHRLVEAERFYQEAARVMPQLVAPKARSGMIALRAGREAEARAILRQAFDIDPFNVRVRNSLEVLDLLEGYETHESTQAAIRFDPKHDKLLARYVARHVDRVYPELCAQFGYRPAQKPLIEVFGQAKGATGHEWFSTRMIGLPYLGPVAASTGHIVGMTSPNDSGKPSRFNWARVVKHELVHVVTLQQTGFNMPHWLAEGLAVWCEGHPRPQEWNELLAKRVAQGKLFDLQTLNFAFTRPQSSDDWQLGYCQAELYVEYMIQRRGPEVLPKLLACYAENLSTPETIRRTLGVPIEEFERGYREHLRHVTAGDSAAETALTPTQFAELVARQRQRPDDLDLAARLAEEYLRRGDVQQAGDLARRVLKSQPRHPVAACVVARVLVRENRSREAIGLLEGLLDRAQPDLKVLNLLAGLRLKANEHSAAADLYRLGAMREPRNLRWTRSLARVYLLAKDDARLWEVLVPLAEADPDDFSVRKKLVELAQARRDHDAIRHWANQALGIDVTDAEIHRALGDALVASREYGRAIEEYEATIELAPEDFDSRYALADALARAGRRAEARQVLEELLRRHGDHREARRLLETLNESDPRDR